MIKIKVVLKIWVCYGKWLNIKVERRVSYEELFLIIELLRKNYFLENLNVSNFCYFYNDMLYLLYFKYVNIILCVCKCI